MTRFGAAVTLASALLLSSCQSVDQEAAYRCTEDIAEWMIRTGDHVTRYAQANCAGTPCVVEGYVWNRVLQSTRNSLLVSFQDWNQDYLFTPQTDYVFAATRTDEGTAHIDLAAPPDRDARETQELFCQLARADLREQ